MSAWDTLSACQSGKTGRMPIPLFMFVNNPRQVLLGPISFTALTVLKYASSGESVGRQAVSWSVIRWMHSLCIDRTSGRFGVGFWRHGEDKKKGHPSEARGADLHQVLRNVFITCIRGSFTTLSRRRRYETRALARGRELQPTSIGPATAELPPTAATRR